MTRTRPVASGPQLDRRQHGERVVLKALARTTPPTIIPTAKAA